MLQGNALLLQKTRTHNIFRSSITVKMQTRGIFIENQTFFYSFTFNFGELGGQAHSLVAVQRHYEK